MSDTERKRVEVEIGVRETGNLRRPFEDIERGAGRAQASVGKLANGMMTDIRKMDRGIMALNHGFMGLAAASMTMGQSFQNSSPHMKQFVDHAQKAASAIMLIHSSALLLRGGLMVFTTLAAGVGRYTTAALAAAGANLALARSHQAVAAAAGQQAAAQHVSLFAGGVGARFVGGGIGAVAGGLAGTAIGGTFGHEGWGGLIGSIGGTAAGTVAPGLIGRGIGLFAGRAAPAAAGRAAAIPLSPMVQAMSRAGGMAVPTAALAPGAAAGTGGAATGAGGIGVGGLIALPLLAAVGAYEAFNWMGYAGKKMFGTGPGKKSPTPGLYDDYHLEMAKQNDPFVMAYRWYDEAWNRGAKLDKGLEASQRQKILTASILQTAIQERRVREPFEHQQRGLLDERALLGIEASRLRFDTHAAARRRQAGYQGRFDTEISRTMGEKALANTPEERAYRANLQDQAERLAEHMGLSSQAAREHVEDAAARQKYFAGKAQTTGRELARASALTESLSKDQRNPEFLKALENETHLRSQLIEYTQKAQHAQQDYVNALKQEKDVTAQNEQQFRSFAAEQERHYRQIRQQQEAKIKGLKMDFAFMDPTEIDKMSQMAQRFVNEVQNPKQGRRGQIAMVGGRARFVPGTVGGFTHEEMQYIKGNPFFDQLREQYADKVTANNPALQKLLEMTGQTEKLEAAARQEKLFADVKMQVQNQFDIQMHVSSDEIAREVHNRLQQPIAEMIQSIGDQMQRQMHMHGVMQAANVKSAVGG